MLRTPAWRARSRPIRPATDPRPRASPPRDTNSAHCPGRLRRDADGRALPAHHSACSAGVRDTGGLDFDRDFLNSDKVIASAIDHEASACDVLPVARPTRQACPWSHLIHLPAISPRPVHSLFEAISPFGVGRFGQIDARSDTDYPLQPSEQWMSLRNSGPVRCCRPLSRLWCFL